MTGRFQSPILVTHRVINFLYFSVPPHKLCFPPQSIGNFLLPFRPLLLLLTFSLIEPLHPTFPSRASVVHFLRKGQMTISAALRHLFLHNRDLTRFFVNIIFQSTLHKEHLLSSLQPGIIPLKSVRLIYCVSDTIFLHKKTVLKKGASPLSIQPTPKSSCQQIFQKSPELCAQPLDNNVKCNLHSKQNFFEQ